MSQRSFRESLIIKLFELSTFEPPTVQLEISANRNVDTLSIKLNDLLADWRPYLIKKSDSITTSKRPNKRSQPKHMKIEYLLINLAMGITL